MYYLLKTEPSAYSFADLQRDQTTIWDGVTNPVAVKHLREMPTGAKLVLYHTGDERQAIGTATVESVDASDPRNPKVRIKAGKKIVKPVTLADQEQQTLQGISSGTARQAFGCTSHRGAVRVSCGQQV